MITLDISNLFENKIRNMRNGGERSKVLWEAWLVVSVNTYGKDSTAGSELGSESYKSKLEEFENLELTLYKITKEIVSTEEVTKGGIRIM